jgi:hypothetical protein
MNSDFVDPIQGSRELRSPIYDVVSFAKQVAVGPVVSFFTHTRNGSGPQVTNLEKANELTAGERMVVYSIRLLVKGAAAADAAALRKAFAVRLKVAGKEVFISPTEKCPYGGVGISDAGSEMNAQVFKIESDDLAIVIPQGVTFSADLVGSAAYTLTDANKGVDFVLELDGIHTVPMN